MSEEMTVRTLMRHLTEMKKLGLADAPIKLEGCDGCVDLAGEIRVSKSSTNEKSVLITAHSS